MWKSVHFCEKGDILKEENIFKNKHLIQEVCLKTTLSVVFTGGVLQREGWGEQKNKTDGGEKNKKTGGGEEKKKKTEGSGKNKTGGRGEDHPCCWKCNLIW